MDSAHTAGVPLTTAGCHYLPGWSESLTASADAAESEARARVPQLGDTARKVQRSQ